MDGWRRAFGSVEGVSQGLVAQGSTASIAPVEARIGHAWFAGAEIVSRGGRARSPILPAIRRTDLAEIRQSRPLRRRPRRIPTDAVVMIDPGSVPAPPADTRSSNANDNQPYLPPKVRSVLREMIFLTIFILTLAGTYYVGRTHGFHRVIWVPDVQSHKNQVV
jgi:hypothetical protein